MTAGRYTAGFITANHVKAYEAWMFAKAQFGDLVIDSVGEPESQNRYVDLAPNNGTLTGLDLPFGTPDSAAPPGSAARWMRDDPVVGPRIRANAGKNTGSRIYFWSGQHPHYNAIQGFPFKFDRISPDEAQQLHPGVTRILNPMLLDSGGAMDVSGIADIDSIGNDWFSDYFERANDPERRHRWHSLNFPTYCNPNLDAEAMKEIEDDLLTADDYEQFVWARFISGSGAVFKNLDAVFTLRPRWTRTAPAHRDLPPWVLELLARAPSEMLSAWIVDEGPATGHTYALTVDFAGRTKTRDATVISIFDLTENRQVCLVSIRDMQSPQQLQWIEGVKAAYRAEELHGDNTPEGAALMAYLRERHGVGVRGHIFSASNKAEYVKRGQFLFEMKEVALIDCPYQRKEFKDFRRIASETKDGKDGPVTYSHPPGKHDDCVAAFLMIAPSMAHGRRDFDRPEEQKRVMDEKGGVLLDFFAGEGAATPFGEEREDSEPTLDDLVFPR